ncbi:MAG: hypothetical protein HQL69_11885 [Magnetococcales bacterium]|nr:hypothetical protein [Magnetococcales bacterium]
MNSPDWGQSAWLIYPGGSEVLYLRKKITLSGLPKLATISVAATDTFEAFINGQKVGGQEFMGGTPSETLDITPQLKTGQNIIAIRSVSSTSGVPAQGIARLMCAGYYCRDLIDNNSAWRTEHSEKKQRNGLITWKHPDYNDVHWPMPTMLHTPPANPVIAPVLSAEDLLELHKGYWIWTPRMLENATSFTRKFNIPEHRIISAWLGISVDGYFRLSVNGITFDRQTSSRSKMGVFNIAPYLHHGTNTVTVLASNDESPYRIAITGLVRTPQTVRSFSSDQQWFLPDHKRAVSLFKISNSPPSLFLSELSDPTNFIFKQWIDRTWKFLFILCLTILCWALFAWLCRHFGGLTQRQGALLFSQPLAITSLFLWALFMVDKDPRLDPSILYNLSTFNIIGIFILAWLSATVLLATARVKKLPEPRLLEES